MHEPGRIFGTGGLGTPEGDRNKYYLMSNREIDYDQAFCRIDYSDDGWLPPTPACMQIAPGADVRCLLSAGPFDLAPGETKPFTIAYVAGETFHWDPMNFPRYMIDLYDPWAFYYGLSFLDIGANAVMAGRVFDNPGVDTDGDGYAGRFRVLVDTVGGEEITDTFYYAGDGVPDFRAAVELPVPGLRFSATNNCVTLRWNGLDCETFVDPVTRITDFEGYNVYMGKEPGIDKLGLLASHDPCNFMMLYWDYFSGRFVVIRQPMTLKELRSIFGKSFDPSEYPYNENGTGYERHGRTYWFISVGWNQSIRAWDDGSPITEGTELRKRFADEIAHGEVTAEIDALNPDLWVLESDPVTGDTVLYHKYYEYEYTINGLSASVPHYFAVTAFDFGDMYNDFASMETSPLDNVTEIWPIAYSDEVLSKGLKVRTYPNPYFGESSDRAAGGDGDIVFANLPPRCTVEIFTVSGDLVRKFSHPGRHSDADSQLRWDLNNKRDKKVKSGIFIYSVESDWGNQIGKIVIIR
ncbi:MAG: T9SS type A sorting domain-containing protein, partial [candidate division Zixibacteria bacterium]|nr:T9SS type A sorting domain-containing protein [candidate division Zixibacteria bacterium]